MQKAPANQDVFQNAIYVNVITDDRLRIEIVDRLSPTQTDLAVSFIMELSI